MSSQMTPSHLTWSDLEIPRNVTQISCKGAAVLGHMLLLHSVRIYGESIDANAFSLSDLQGQC